MDISVTDLHRREHRFPVFDAAGLAGTSFKPEHFPDIEADDGIEGFFEIHAENYMGDGGLPHRLLERIRMRFPVSLHGVCMSIGGEAPLNRDHLRRFKALVDRYEPALVSEHLAWSTHDDLFYNDLLPLPYTQATLARVADHIDEMQETIGRPILLENPATYLVFAQSTFAEQDFLREIVQRTGCGLLLDINNVFVSAVNHATDPWNYLASFPLHHVGEIHLAGHAEDTDSEGKRLLIDSHDRPIADPVWDLYTRVIGRTGPVATLVEWDADVPAWPILRREADAAGAILARHAPAQMLGHRHG